MAIDLLSIEPQVISRDLSSKYILLAGKEKIGKTEFCTQVDKSLILAFEVGTNARPGAMVQKIRTWGDFKTVLRQLEKPEVKAKFNTICIDTVGICWELCEKYICAQNDVQVIKDIGYGAGYKMLDSEFADALRRITMGDYGLIMTCHLKEEYDDDGRLIGLKPNLPPRCLGIVNGLVDVIGVITQEWNEKGESTRWIQTRATRTVNAGTRFRYLKPKIPFGYHEFADALAEAISMEEQNGAVVVDRLPTDTSAADAMTFDQARDTARQLWVTLTSRGDEETNKDMANRILSKLEKIFGHPTKFSDITENQLDLFILAINEVRELL